MFYVFVATLGMTTFPSRKQHSILLIRLDIMTQMEIEDSGE